MRQVQASRVILFCAILSAGASAVATDRKSTLAEARRAYDEQLFRRTGGEVVRPGKGHVAVVNGQKAVPQEVVSEALDQLRGQTRLEFKVVEETSPDDVVLRLVEDTDKPPMLAAPEAGWAEINVKALSDDLKTETGKRKFLPLRVQKMILRAFAYACGAGGSGYPGNVLDIATVRDLDYREKVLPVDAASLAVEHATKRGITPAETATYRQACEEGWAPAPTNDVQKKIWDDVHAIPQKPLQITFDPAAQKGKVTK